MKRRALLLIFLASFTLQGLAQPSLKGLPLTYTALGPIHLGMSHQELRQLGYKLSEEPSGYDGCAEFTIRGDAKVVVMLEDNRLTRISSYDPSIATLAGTRVGPHEKKVKLAYRNRLEIKPHQYDEKGHYLVVKSSNGKYGIVHETNGSRVTAMHTGLKAPAQYVEGCL